MNLKSILGVRKRGISQEPVMVVLLIPFSLEEAPVEKRSMSVSPCRPRRCIPVCGFFQKRWLPCRIRWRQIGMNMDSFINIYTRNSDEVSQL